MGGLPPYHLLSSEFRRIKRSQRTLTCEASAHALDMDAEILGGRKTSFPHNPTACRYQQAPPDEVAFTGKPPPRPPRLLNCSETQSTLGAGDFNARSWCLFHILSHFPLQPDSDSAFSYFIIALIFNPTPPILDAVGL